MTVTYSLNVAKARLCGFAKLLGRWRGSIYKLLYREMIIFCGLYYSLSLMYRYILTPSQRVVFEKLTIYCEAFTKLIPLSFVLGFYVSIVVGRWWNQFMTVPWPEKAAMLIAAHVHGGDERGRLIRRTLVRYLLQLQALTFKAVSTSVRKRFPTEDHLVEAGLMTREEKLAYDEVPGTHGKWWVPAVWFTSLIVRCRKEGRIKDDYLMKQLLDELHDFRGNCGMLFAYDWISIPLVYTQTVTIATYTYFLATVMGRQYLDPDKGYHGHDVDLYIPVFTILEFFFFMGWLKVAEQLINPFGEDDDDFDLNWMMDRNLLVVMNVVDDLYNKCPSLIKDIYWDDSQPVLPYTKSSMQLRTQPHLGSAMNLNIDPEAVEFLPMKTIQEDQEEDGNYTSVPQSPANDSVLIPNLQDSRGSRFLNMLIGQSTENISASTTKLSDKGQNSFFAPFRLKTPIKKRRKPPMSSSQLLSSTSTLQGSRVSINEQSNLNQSARQLTTSNSLANSVLLPEESRSLIVNMDQPERSRAFDFVRNERPRPTSFSVDETGKDFLVSRADDGAFTIEIRDGHDRQPSFPRDGTPTPTNPEPPSREVKEPEQPAAPEKHQSMDSNASDESLSPVDSNQSTITSFTELIRRNANKP